MAASNDSQIVIKLLDAPSHALLRKFGSLGYSLLLRLQSELTAIESHSGDALLAGIDLHNVGATTVALGAEASTESRLREEELQNKLIKYYTLLNLFSKIQSSRIPHEAVLEGFIRFVKDDLQKDVAHTTWVDEADLMGPFTNRLPQQILITMNIVSIFRKMKRFKWFAAIIHIRLVDWRDNKLVFCTRRHPRSHHHRGSNASTIRDTLDKGTNGCVMGVRSCICIHDKALGYSQYGFYICY
ncbi:hypothetical protein PMAA_064420 [Talaromyces marneffei ATCC 18224]|uniref:Uncharacterized protein n=1 Tax=Talaromyces marneffei (strain ATCC 18224 / CBS 334.59 / QM 7333) TaxID=441960 RepID=B6QAR9_TALMQ|nr:hypothetical protein PMAA_064420 [Talaromyces marneffei ATCC 18224]